MFASPSRAARVAVALLVSILLLAAALLLPESQASDNPEATDGIRADTPVSSPDQPHGLDDGRQAPELVAAERARIRAHLERVEAELRTAPTDHLPEEVQVAREQQVEVLREYRKRGVFPRNLAYPHAKVPVFVDDRGVHCAVGYLLHRSGADSVVTQIAERRNFARVPELADEPGLAEWLASVGLSLEEAARIQPAYCGDGGMTGWPCDAPEPEPADYPFSDYSLASVGAAGLNGLMIGVNVVGARNQSSTTFRGWLGLASGMAGAGLGAWGLRHGESATGAGWLNVAAGAAGALSGYAALRRAGSPSAERYREQDAATEQVPSSLSVSLSPTLAPNSQGGAGLSVRVAW